MGATQDFWKPHSIGGQRDQPGNPHAQGELSASKAKKILKDGTVRGHPITPKQRGYFGLVASGKARKK